MLIPRNCLFCCFAIIACNMFEGFAEEEKTNELWVFNSRWSHNDNVSFTAGGEFFSDVQEMHRYLDGAGCWDGDVQNCAEGIAKYLKKLKTPMQKAVFLKLAGERTLRALRDCDDNEHEEALRRRWAELGVELCRRAVIEAQVSQVEEELIIAESFQSLGRLYNDGYNDTEASNLALWKLYEVRVNMHNTAKYLIHWPANRRMHQLREEAMFRLLNSLPDEQISELVIDPTLLDTALKSKYWTAKKAKAVFSLSANRNKRAISWLHAISESELLQNSEKKVLKEAAEMLEKWEDRTSQKSHESAGKRVPAPPAPQFPFPFYEDLDV